jgi:hypothetical protein
MRDRPTFSARIDERTVAAALVGFALMGALAFVLMAYFFTPS